MATDQTTVSVFSMPSTGTEWAIYALAVVALALMIWLAWREHRAERDGRAQ